MDAASGKIKVDTQNRVSTFFVSVRIGVEVKQWERKGYHIVDGVKKRR